MADYSVVDNDKSKIVTEFLLNTCRLKQPTKHHVRAAGLCFALSMVGDDTVALIPLTTAGSVAEFYIQPMLSCVGDIDVMINPNDVLAIPDGYQSPSQLPAEFHSRVKVFEITDSGCPGYVYLKLSYLLRENTDTGKYNAVRCIKLKYHGSYYNHFRKLPDVEYEVKGPALTSHIGTFSRDNVPSIRCLSWPLQASDWPTRHRSHGWPDSATVDRVVSGGCDIVPVAHHLCRQDEWTNNRQLRLSFSRAEILLLNSWMPVQQLIYHMLRVYIKTERLADITDSSGTKILSNYHIKTLMLWSCELQPRNRWIDDLNVVKMCAILLRFLGMWLKIPECPHYFVNNCNLIDVISLGLHMIFASQQMSISDSWISIVSQLMSISDSSLSTWFVNNYLRQCAHLCPDRVSRLFDDVSTSMKLQNAVSAIVDWRLNTALEDLWIVCHQAEYEITIMWLRYVTPNVHVCHHWIYELPKIDASLNVFYTAVAFLHIIYKTTRNGMNGTLMDFLATVLGHAVYKRCSSDKLSSVLSLNQATKLMKSVANNSRSIVQLIEIGLSMAYLYKALRCKDSDSDSIYCLANVYLAVLYYTTGHYQKAIDHCALVTRSQCSSRVVQGELLPKIDDNVDTVLGLTVFYQYVRTAALIQQQQTQHISVFTTELFAHYLHITCLSAIKCCHLMSSNDEVQRFMRSFSGSKRLFIADMLCTKLTHKRICYYKRSAKHTCLQELTIASTKLDTSELVKLLQKSALELLTTYRRLQAQKFGSVVAIVTTDFEALYAYKRGDYQRCLQLSTKNVRKLLHSTCIYTVSQKKTSPTFLAVTRESIDGFL